MVYPTPSKIYIDDTHFLVEIMGIKFSGNVKIVEWELHGQPVTDYDHYIPFGGDDNFVSFDHEGYMNFEQDDVPLYLAMMDIPTKTEYTEGNCDCCGYYSVTDIKLPSGKELYKEDHFGNCNFPCGWQEFFELVEIERTYLRKG